MTQRYHRTLYLLILGLAVLQIIYAADAGYEERYNTTVHRAQCQARCLSVYGALDLPTVYSVMDTYKPYACVSDDLNCQQCMAACNHRVTSVRECKQTCDSSACRKSCSFLFRLFSSKQISRDTTESVSSIELTTPHSQCQGVDQGDSMDLPAYMYVKWEVLNGSASADIPLMFVLSTTDIVLGKTPSNMIPIDDLTPGGTYSLFVTAVSEHGIVHKPIFSEKLKMFKEWKAALPPTDLKASEVTVDPSTGGVSAVVQWKPHNLSMSCYYSIYWMSATTGDNGFKKLDAPLPDWSYELTGLGFSQNYTVHIYSYDISARPEYESPAAVTWFITPDCLTSMNFDLSICAPAAVTSFMVTNVTRFNNSVSVSLSWKSSMDPMVNENATAFNYSIKFSRIPTLLLRSDDQTPHRGEVTVDGEAIECTLTELYPDSLYKFYIVSVSEGGASDVSVTEINTGDPQVSVVAQAIQSQPLDQPVRAKKHNIAYVYAVVAVLVATALSVTMFAVYRTRIRKNKHHKMPFNLTTTELNYMMDTSMDDLEVDVKCLEFDKEIGSGAFGRVVKASVKGKSSMPPGLHKNMTVAVKMLKEYASVEDECNFVKEMRLMKHVGRHPCIVSMIACSTQPAAMCIVMDYCEKGDLKSYLRYIREEISSHAGQLEVDIDQKHEEKQALISRPSAITRDDMHYADCNSAGQSSGSHTEPQLTVSEEERNQHLTAMFLSFARQIAFGMEYLAQKKFVHRDLAARNVLVCGEGVVKIADFGLTRDIYENSVYQKSGGGKLPVKWMALESIFDQTYTTQSDVWSYGIVLWEIVTMGGSPYPGIANCELLSLIKQGHRMAKPENCSNEIYDVMLSCWHPVPTKRQTFTELVAKIDSMLENGSNYMDLHVNTNSDCYTDQKFVSDGSSSDCHLAKGGTDVQCDRKLATKTTKCLISPSCPSLDMLSQIRPVDKLRNCERARPYTETHHRVISTQRSFSESDILEADNFKITMNMVDEVSTG